jgi:hypothetical protein
MGQAELGVGANSKRHREEEGVEVLLAKRQIMCRMPQAQSKRFAHNGDNIPLLTMEQPR